MGKIPSQILVYDGHQRLPFPVRIGEAAAGANPEFASHGSNRPSPKGFAHRARRQRDRRPAIDDEVVVQVISPNGMSVTMAASMPGREFSRVEQFAAKLVCRGISRVARGGSCRCMVITFGGLNPGSRRAAERNP